MTPAAPEHTTLLSVVETSAVTKTGYREIERIPLDGVSVWLDLSHQYVIDVKDTKWRQQRYIRNKTLLISREYRVKSLILYIISVNSYPN